MPNPPDSTTIAYRTLQLPELQLFYREAGDPAAPMLLLLHGFPTSSHMFRDLLPRLADRYHVVAPDLPGFGFSGAPAADTFNYTFAHLTEIIEQFVDRIGLQRYALYMFDYGGPVALRLALRHPERVTGLIVQNANAYLEGLADSGWAPIKAYWQDPSPAKREALRAFLTTDLTRFQYHHGVTEAERRIAPEAIALDAALLARPQSADIQLDLFRDYQTNVALYPQFQDYLRTHRPPTLVVWGRNDPFFLTAGVESLRRDTPRTEVVYYDTGHFALETHAREIAGEIRRFLAATV